MRKNDYICDFCQKSEPPSRNLPENWERFKILKLIVCDDCLQIKLKVR